MPNIFVAGLANIETTLRVDGFPIEYQPVNYASYAISTSVSAVGYNVAKALTNLGNAVSFASLIGRDLAGDIVEQRLLADGIRTAGVLRQLDHTAQSVVMYDPTGQRRIATDLKDIQDHHYPEAQARLALAGCELAVLCNINFARSLLPVAQALRVPIATDLHVLADLDDEYNRDWLQAADIIFQSHEGLAETPEQRAAAILARFRAHIVVIGMGNAGSLLAVRDQPIVQIPAATVRPVVNTVGAGDAFFASFVHFYLELHDPYAALERASVFAAHKIGANGGAAGLLSRPAFEQVWAEFVVNRGARRWQA